MTSRPNPNDFQTISLEDWLQEQGRWHDASLANSYEPEEHPRLIFPSGNAARSSSRSTQHAPSESSDLISFSTDDPIRSLVHGTRHAPSESSDLISFSTDDEERDPPQTAMPSNDQVQQQFPRLFDMSTGQTSRDPSPVPSIVSQRNDYNRPRVLLPTTSHPRTRTTPQEDSVLIDVSTSDEPQNALREQQHESPPDTPRVVLPPPQSSSEEEPAIAYRLLNLPHKPGSLTFDQLRPLSKTALAWANKDTRAWCNRFDSRLGHPPIPSAACTIRLWGDRPEEGRDGRLFTICPYPPRTHRPDDKGDNRGADTSGKGRFGAVFKTTLLFAFMNYPWILNQGELPGRCIACGKRSRQTSKDVAHGGTPRMAKKIMAMSRMLTCSPECWDRL